MNNELVYERIARWDQQPMHEVLSPLVRLEREAAASDTTCESPFSWSLVEWNADVTNPRPSDREKAWSMTLRLYAIHRRISKQPVHRGGVPLGRALGNIGIAPNSLEMRLLSLGQASTEGALFRSLSSLFRLMAGDSQPHPLDYGWLSRDLQAWFGHQRRTVTSRWMRDAAIVINNRKKPS